nr:GAP family protein [Herbiconiux flava]
MVASLLPLSLGIVMSPLAIMALVAVLLSGRPRQNGVAFLLGWAVAIVVALGVSYTVFGLLELRERTAPPVWVPTVRLVLGLLLVGGAVWIYRRGRAHTRAMAEAQSPAEVAAAAPQLPGWLQKVSTFSPGRSFLLGLGIFLLNPVDASCAVLAGLDVRLAEVEPSAGVAALVVFGIVGVLPIGTPVVLVLVRGESAAPVLTRIRTWIASHTSVLNAALVLVIAVLQLQKAVSTFLAY